MYAGAEFPKDACPELLSLEALSVYVHSATSICSASGAVYERLSATGLRQTDRHQLEDPIEIALNVVLTPPSFAPPWMFHAIPKLIFSRSTVDLSLGEA